MSDRSAASEVLERARVTVIQDGARLHYAVPLAIQQAGSLERMYTTWYSSPGSGARMVGKILRACRIKVAVNMLHRYSPGLNGELVWPRGWINLYQRVFSRGFNSDVQRYSWEAERLAKYVKRKGFGRSNALFGFIGSIHPSLLAFAKERGLVTIGDQYIAPVAVQAMEEKLQNQRFPGWSAVESVLEDPKGEQWEKESWKHADHVTCASEYVRRGLLGAGLAASQLSVLPYPIDASQFQMFDRRGRTGPLRVGFVGAIGLRKGAPYVMEVAKRFPRERVVFSLVGPVHLTREAAAELGKHVEVVGPVPRPEVLRRLRAFDVFFLPSTCEGSAGAIMEAMATGLPTVTSPNSGSLIEEGVTGFVREYTDIDGFSQAIDRLASDEELRIQMGHAARAAAEQCSIDAYSRQWSELLHRVMDRSEGSGSH